MARTFWFLAIATLTTTLAQSQAARPGTQATQPVQSRDHLVTVTGCIERGATGSPTSTTGTTADKKQIAGPDTKFVLTSVVAEENPTGTTGSGQPGSISDARAYRLDDADQSKVAGHVGQTVEISGTVEPQSTTGTTGSTAPTGSTATPDEIAPKIKVATIRVVSASCAKK